MHETEQFKPGDLVQLKSGGPVMTVREIQSPSCVTVEWFNEAQWCSVTFHLASLVHRGDFSHA